MKHPTIGLAALLCIVSLGCSEDKKDNGPTPAKVTLQLKWVPQAQFAGYYAAAEKGFYEQEKLEVTIKPGAPDIDPKVVVETGGAQFGLAWLPMTLEAIEEGSDIINIAQIFQRSGGMEIAWKDSGISKPEDWAGKKVGSWMYGHEAELFALMRKVGLDPEKDLEMVKQPFDMDLILNREIDAAQAMVYNEYAMVLETINPATGELYQAEDLEVISFEDHGTGMLQDGIISQKSWLEDPKNHEIAVRFLRASFRGWIYCRDHYLECVDFVLAAGTALGENHQAWMMNEVNGLIWPSSSGIGHMNSEAFTRTGNIAKEFGNLKNTPNSSSYRTDLTQAALEGITEDSLGVDFQKEVVILKEGGK